MFVLNDVCDLNVKILFMIAAMLRMQSIAKHLAKDIECERSLHSGLCDLI